MGYRAGIAYICPGVNELKVFCYHGNKFTILFFYSIFITTPEVSSKLCFVEICQVSEKLWLFNHKRADFWLPNLGFKRSLFSLLKQNTFHLMYVSQISIEPVVDTPASFPYNLDILVVIH